MPSRTRLLLAVVLLSLAAVACGPGEHGPWLNEHGEIISNAYVLEYDGLARCDQLDVTFFHFFGRQYAKDPNGVLGELVSLDGLRTLTFTRGTDLPSTAERSLITHNNREIYLNAPDVEDYLYIVIDNQVVERWPRAEQRCTVGL